MQFSLARLVVASAFASALCPCAQAAKVDLDNTAWKELVSRARVIVDEASLANPASISKKDVLRAEGEFKHLQDVKCKFAPKVMGGTTPKFACEMEDGRVLKIKYVNAERQNPEVYSAPVVSRLFWALGFASDMAYQVNIACEGCPADPWPVVKDEASLKAFQASGQKAVKWFFGAAFVSFKGDEVTREGGKEGWKFGDLELATQRATQAQRDALKLMAVIVQHGDSKPDNHTVTCKSKFKDGVCMDPVLYISDVGATMGKSAKFSGSSVTKVNFKKWSETSIWADEQGCKTNLSGDLTDATIRNPTISEAGRAFLAERLNALTDEQIDAIFRSGSIDQRNPQKIKDANGNEHVATIADWALAFKAKRAEINSRKCP